ncbi:MAG: hypothetical protein V1809_10420 [Planctomycetota bacterium]
MTIHRANGLMTLDFDPRTLSGEVALTQGAGRWAFDLAAARGVRCGAAEPSKYLFPWQREDPAMARLRPLSAADLEAGRATERGLELDFRADGAFFRVRLELEPAAAEMIFTLSPTNAGTADLVAAELPGALTPADGAASQVLVGAMDQGRLYTGKPGNLGWPGRDLTGEVFLPESRMRWRWWGVLAEKSGYCAIIEENADAELALRRDGPGGSLATSVRWLPSMGLLAYERRVRYCFEPAPTVTSLAKRYRRWTRERGLLVTLREKAEARPRVGRLIGATNVFAGYTQTSLDYAGTLRELRRMGHERFYFFPIFHLNHGFQPQGADAGLPSDRIDLRGRLGELRELEALCGAWCYLEGLDIAFKPELERLAQRNFDGSRALNWRRNDWLWYQACRRRMPESVRGLREPMALFDAVHFDTTTSNALMECYESCHPHDRRADRALRIEMLDEAARLGLVVASEGCRDWAIAHSDMASNKVPAAWGADRPWWSVPLQQIAFHDAIVSQWWEVAGYDCPEFDGGRVAEQALTDTLYGDPPLIFPVGGQKTGGTGTGLKITYFEHTLDNPLCRRAAGRAAGVARLHARVGNEEMVSHDFLTGDGAVQETVFAGGTRVVANFGPAPFPLAGGRAVPPLDCLVE